MGTYCIVARACEQGKQAERGLMLFEAMDRQGAVPDVRTYSSSSVLASWVSSQSAYLSYSSHYACKASYLTWYSIIPL